ncbi:MAG: AfsR/SARP family transcriptional regulator [Candidatus Nanopelagicales bacterium]
MGIDLLGPLQVDGARPLEPRDRVALTVLALTPGRVIPPEEFAEAIWGDDAPSSWPKQVQICIGRLRKVLGAEAIQTVSGGYRLPVSDDALDSRRFEQLVTRAQLLAASGEPDRAASTYLRALALWRGRPFGDLEDWVPARSETTRLEEMHRTAQEDLLEARLATGEHRQVAVEAEAAVRLEPLRERRWAILATAQYRGGRQGDALRSLRTARRTLRDRLGVDPIASGWMLVWSITTIPLGVCQF